MRYFFIMVFSGSLLAAPLFSSHGQTTVAPIQEWMKGYSLQTWLREHANQIKTLEAGQGLGDLQILKTYLTNRKIIALGEATHGTKEFFQLKHRMLEFLVKELGVKVFAIEASFSDALAVNHYITTGQGDASSAIKGMHFWTWDTQEMEAMVKWMSQYNATQTEEKKLKFYGFDMQEAALSAQITLSNLSGLDKQFANQMSSTLKKLLNKKLLLTKLSPQEQQKVIKDVEDICHFLSERNPPSNEAKQKKAFELKLKIAQMLQQYLSMHLSPFRKATAVRDSCMAANVQWIENYEDGKSPIMLWAHNSHVAKTVTGGSIKAMGSYLHRQYGQQYYSIGFDFNKGSFQAKGKSGLQAFTVGEALAESSGFLFSRSGTAQFYLDFQSASLDGFMHRFLTTPIASRTIGAEFDPAQEQKYYRFEKLMDAYDAVIFIDQTTRAVPNKKE